MNNIKTKLFPIDALFYKVKYKKLPYKAADLKSNKEGLDTIPVLSAGVENQGLAYYAPKQNATIIKNAISVSANGANSGAMFYHPFEFSILQDSYAIKYKDRELNENEYLFMLTSLQKVIKSNFDWTNKACWSRIKHKKIELPINDEGKIDFEFINSYMNAIERNESEIIRSNLIESKLVLESISEDENREIFDFFSGKHKSKIVKISDYFKVSNNLSLNKNNFIFSENAEYPYFTRTVFNNGIAGYVEHIDDKHKIIGNVIAVGLLQMEFFYIDHDFYAGQFTKTISPLFQEFNENIGLFFAVLFNKQREKFKSVLVRDFNAVFLNSEIEIPINNKDELDLAYIERIMELLKKKILGKLFLQETF